MTMRKHLLVAAFCAAMTVVLPTPAAAKEKALGTFGAWQAYVSDEGGQKTCYMVTVKTIKATKIKRATPYLMITHRPVEASTDVFSYGAGTLLDSRRGAVVSIDKATVDLFSVRDIAWARDAQIDHKIARAIRAASSAKLKSYTGTKNAKPIIDVFDLKGAPMAYHAIGKACGLPGETSVKSTKKRPMPAQRKK